MNNKIQYFLSFLHLYLIYMLYKTVCNFMLLCCGRSRSGSMECLQPPFLIPSIPYTLRYFAKQRKAKMFMK